MESESEESSESDIGILRTMHAFGCISVTVFMKVYITSELGMCVQARPTLAMCCIVHA